MDAGDIAVMVGFVALIGALVLVGRRAARTRQQTAEASRDEETMGPEVEAEEEPAPDATTSAPPAPPTISGAPPAPREGMNTQASAREKREAEIRRRAKTGKCLYCNERASKQQPTFVPVRPLFDSLLRYLNTTPNKRWKIEVTRDIRYPQVLCGKHHEQVLGYFEEKIAIERREYAKFVSEQRLGMYEFEKHGVDEIMVEDMTTVRRGKKKTKPAAEVVRLTRPESIKRASNDG